MAHPSIKKYIIIWKELAHKSQKEHMGDSRTQEEVERQFTDKDKLGIDNSIAAHIR